MLGGLLGSNFSSKCKQAIKHTNARLVQIRNKKQATLQWLKKDVADLLAAGHEANAFGRIDALIVEINHASCYDIIDQYCQYVLSQLPNLQKQRECPREAMGAISTIIFAAARFPDLPELCHLRREFTERYGSSMESSVNDEFVEKIQRKSFPEEKRLQLLQRISEEFSVRWDSKALVHPSSNANARQPVQPRKDVLPRSANMEGSSVQQAGRKEKIPSKGICGSNLANGVPGEQMQMEPKDIYMISTSHNGQSYNPLEKTRKVVSYGTENPILYQDNNEIPLKPWRKNDGNHKDDEIKDGLMQTRITKVQNDQEFSLRKQVVSAKSLKVKPSNIVLAETKSNDNDYLVVEEITNNVTASSYSKFDRIKYVDAQERAKLKNQEGLVGSEKQSARSVNNNGYVIPPYAKPMIKDIPSKSDQTAQNIIVGGHGKCAATVNTAHPSDKPFYEEKPKPVSVRKKLQKPPDIEISEGTFNEKPARHSPGDQSVYGARQKNVSKDDIYVEEKKTRELRVPYEDETDCAIDYGKPLPRPPREKYGGRHTAPTNGGQNDKEEMVMDKILEHYCRKGTDKKGCGDRTRVRAPTPSHTVNPARVESPGRGNIHGLSNIHPISREAVVHPQRAISLPSEPITLAEIKAPARATSMQSSPLQSSGGHVHPNLPEYSELAARLAAIRKT